jgi:tRNA-2-methylthio-N6-dimethylallyladenosine synthase
MLQIKTERSQSIASKSVYIETFGCQMNKSDSEHMLGLLDEIGYQQTADINIADLMILNTCAIRESAEEKIYSYLGRWRKIKENHGNALIAIGGCVAQDAGQNLIARAPFVDIVFGTHNLHRLPELVLQAQESKGPVVEVFQELPDDLPDLPVIRHSAYSAWVSIIYGCDYNCTYCIVPFVRGREKSRAPEAIFNEIKELGGDGYKEVTLLGQNVTAYGHDLQPKIHLGDLVRKVGEIEEIKRIRFLTGHPRDLNSEIITAVAEVEAACEAFHLPIQSGDDRTLKRMARGYSVDFYKRQVEEIRQRLPKAAITSDLIVGFPGETEAEFMNTVSLVQEICFDACNTAAFSPRPHTPAANWPNQIPENEKNERLRLLNAVVTQVAHDRNKLYLDRTCEVLVEGQSQRNAGRVAGRTRSNKLVNFEGTEELFGKLVDVHITGANPWALRGHLVN